MKNIFKIVLLLLAAVLTYFIIAKVKEPIEFEKTKTERYTAGIKRLMNIRDAQVAYYNTHGKYAGTFDSLTNFIDSGYIYVISRKDTTVIKKNNRGIDEYVNVTIIDTVGTTSIKDSIFKGENYKSLGSLTINENEVPITLKTKLLTPESEDSTVKIVGQSIFKASILKKDLLKGLDEGAILTELNKPSKIDGPELRVGSLTVPTTEGNWTKEYENRIIDAKK